MRGAHVEAAAVQRDLALAEEQLRPVWSMLKPVPNIGAGFEIREE